MSAKLLHSLTDDNPDLKKQIGCMTGIFQLFDRHHILTGRRINGPNHKRLPAGHSHLSSSNIALEPNNERYLQTVTERSPNKHMNENQRVSMESSTTSFSSSSCSSSFSSLDCSKTAQPEPHSFDRTIFSEKPFRDPPMNQPNASPLLGRESLDFRDVVKDSIYREARGLSVKTSTKEAVSRIVKHIDSPRPLPLSKSVDGSFGVGSNGKPRVPVDLNESLRVLAKLQEAPRYFNEARESPRSSYEAKDGSLFPLPKDVPRFSFDGREIPRPSFESSETFKSTSKFRELPRLSLDSRESSMRGSDNDPKSNSILKDLQMHRGKLNNRITNSQQELGTYKRPPGVVAKLMGLETLPNANSATESQMGFIKICPGEDREPFSRSSKTTDESKKNRVFGSPRSSLKDPISPRLRHPDPVLKPISTSKFPIEPAHWRQPDGCRGFQKPAFRNCDTPTRPPNSSPSVYREDETRLKDLEFKQSEKDLRALKQMVMQNKGLLETKTEDRATNFVSQRNYNSPKKFTSVDQNPRFTDRRNPQNNHPISASIKGTILSQTFESPIVIMKPAKLNKKSNSHASSVILIGGFSGVSRPRSDDSVDSRKGLINGRTTKDLTPKQIFSDPGNRTLGSPDRKNSGRTLRSTQTSSRPQQLPRENTGSSGRSSGSVSPRLQQRRLELEKRSHSPIPSSDASKSRRQATKQPTESGSPGGKLRPRSPKLRQGDDQLSEISSETRILSHQGDDISLCSDSNFDMATQMDGEVNSADRSAKMNCSFLQQGRQSPSRKIANKSVSSLKQKKQSTRLYEDGSMAELAAVALEQPSPVSVLDASFYTDDMPSPMKNISNAFKDEFPNSGNPSEDERNPVDLHCLSDSIGPNFSSAMNPKKLENIDNLVQKLRQLNSNHNEATTDYIASLCENTNPDHRYISEILLASGLLLKDLSSGLTSIQLHPSDHPINPDLFSVLEQTKASTGAATDKHNGDKIISSKPIQEKLHRRLVFDFVDEILVQKLTSLSHLPEPWPRADKLAGRTLNGKQLLRDLCSEIDQFPVNNSAYGLGEEDDLKGMIWEDVMHRSENWADFRKEASVVVLDVERQIFKDLIDEIVSGEAADLRTNCLTKPNRRCRQLFAK